MDLNTSEKSLPLGTRIISVLGEEDHGAMSWDNDEFEVHRRTGPGAEGVIFVKAFHDAEGWCYGVFFPKAEVWVYLYDHELETNAYRIIEHGDGQRPTFGGPNPYRDPYVVKQIAEQKRLDG